MGTAASSPTGYPQLRKDSDTMTIAAFLGRKSRNLGGVEAWVVCPLH